MRIERIRETLQEFDCSGTFYGIDLMDFDKEDLCRIINIYVQKQKSQSEEYSGTIDFLLDIMGSRK